METTHLDGHLRPTDPGWLEAAARRALRGDDEVHDAAVAVAVHGQSAVLAGNVSTLAERRRAADVVRSLPGIAEVDDYLVESPDAVGESTTLAAHLESALASRHPNAHVTVAILGGRAVIAGHAEDHAMREEIARTARHLEPRLRVVNRLVIDGEGEPARET